MHEGDPVSARSGARRVVDEPVAFGAAALERGIEVGDAVADVVDPGAAAAEELSDGTVRIARGEELHRRAAEGKPDDRGPVGGFPGAGFDAQDVAVEGQGGVEVRDGDADVRDRRVGQTVLRELCWYLTITP